MDSQPKREELASTPEVKGNLRYLLPASRPAVVRMYRPKVLRSPCFFLIGGGRHELVLQARSRLLESSH